MRNLHPHGSPLDKLGVELTMKVMRQTYERRNSLALKSDWNGMPASA
jgi:hypothetical protein